MLQSLFVYGSLSLALFFLGKNAEGRERYYNNLGRQPSFWAWETIVLLFLVAFISGVRWNVGVDYLSYLEKYNNYLTLGHTNRKFEWGFDAISRIFAYLNAHFSIYFGFWALLQFFFIYYALKDERYLWPYLGFVIIFGPHYLSWMNGIRQMLAACMFVYAVQFIKFRKLIPYLLIILAATLIHKSAILLILFYFIPQKDYFKNRYVNLALCIVTLIIGLNPYWLQATDSLKLVLSSIGYEGYADNFDILVDSKTQMALGPRRLSIILLNMLVVWYTPKLKSDFEETNYVTYFNLAFIGVLLHNLFANAGHIFLRPVTYFTIFLALTTSYLLCYLKLKSPKGVSIEFIIVFLLAISNVLISIVADYGKGDMDTTNYKFFWNYVF